jgi:hypothetical protein
VTVTSGKQHVVHFRFACDKALRYVVDQVAFLALRSSEWARAYYDEREPGSGHGALQDGQLMSQRQILEGDGRRPEEQGTEDGPETDHDKH